MTKLEYKYDSQNQLVRVDDYDQNYTFTYSYDTNGNMEYSYKYVLGSTSTGDIKGISSFAYDSTWSDKLTYSTEVGAITYDEIGNPITYGGSTLTWTGRQLDSFKGTGVDASYKYDSDGMRVSKTVNGVKCDYYYVDGKLYYEKRGSKELYFSYGNDGNLLRIRLSENGTDLYYYVVCNVRGDVVALYTGAGAVKAEYKYDAWGKVLSVTGSLAEHIGVDNPLRYRGYYYDNETGYYYLRSRYYNPEVGRFINADSTNYIGASGSELSYNIFTYCENNAIKYCDPNGYTIKLSGSKKNQEKILLNLQKITNNKLKIENNHVRIKTKAGSKSKYSKGNKLIFRMINSKKTCTIKISSDVNYERSLNSINATNKKGSSVEVYFNPSSKLNTLNKNPSTGIVEPGKRPAYIGLVHELIHADRAMRGSAIGEKKKSYYSYRIRIQKKKLPGYSFFVDVPTYANEYEKNEEYATIGLKYYKKDDITENDIRKEHGLRLRGAYLAWQ